MRTPYPPPRAADAADDTLAWAVEGERRERILRDHPEYRDAIARGVERVGEVNPRAHIALHTGIDEQLAGNDPPEVRATFDRLLALDHDRHDVEHALANVLTRELWAAQSEHRAFDNAHYLARLADLPLDDTATDTEDDAPDADMVLELPPATLTAADREKLHQLPRSLGTWEGDLTDLPIDVGRRGSPLCALWADTADGTVRSLTPDFDVAPGDLTLAAFVAAALRPKEGRAELPARVRVHPELATALRAALGELGVDVDAAEELAFAHDALDSLARFLAEPAQPRRRRRRRRQ